MDWQKTLTSIKSLYKNYSVFDIAASLFISSLWLPNNGSSVKHQLHVSLFASMDPVSFQPKNKINSYKDFEKLCIELYRLTPDFPSLEDYIPNFDWGSVKYHLEGKNYKIFYGTEISHIYDFISAFELLYVSFDEEYFKLSGRSPKQELKQTLSLQDRIIKSVVSQPDESNLENLKLGHIEVASNEFWNEAKEIFTKISATDLSDFSTKKDFVLELGSMNLKELDEKSFGNNIFEGKLIPVFFISYKNYNFPILPRRFSGILIDKWSEIFSKHHNLIKKDDLDYQESLSLEVSQFIGKRFYKDNFHPIVSAVHDDDRPHELTFSGYLISEDKLILFYVPKPFNNKKDAEDTIKGLAPKINKALELLNKNTLRFGLHLEGKTVEYRSKIPDKKFKIHVFTVLPQATTKMFSVKAPKNYPGNFVFLDQFLAVMDEVEEKNEFSEFIDYLGENENKIKFPITTLIDKYGSFRDSYGVLVPGAREPDVMVIDLQWGTDFRYKSLSQFWEIYPEVDFLDHPRSWKVKKETSKEIRLVAKNHFGSVIYTKIANTHIFITSPLDIQEYEQGSVSNLLVECLADYFSRFEKTIEKHCFFSSFKELRIILFSDTLIKDSKFKHIQHLKPNKEYWKTDAGFPKPVRFPGIRLVYNFDKIRDEFQKSKTNNIEIELFLEIFNKLNVFCDDKNIEKYIKEIEKEKGKLPRFKTLYIQKNVSFPEFVNPEIPVLNDHKLSRKKEAQLAHENGIKEGKYKLKKATETLNQLRDVMVSELEKEINEYSYEENIKYLITRSDALINKFSFEEIRIKESLKHDVDFIRESQYSQVHQDFVSNHKNYRYLLEKFVQIKPSGKKFLESKSFRYLIALVDKIYEIYSASDNLHYEIYSVGLTIDRDFLLKVNYEEDLDSMQRIYGEKQAKIRLGLLGNESDRVSSNVPMKDHLNDLDKAFKKDFGFGMRNMVNVLQVMSQWPVYDSTVSESPYYSATSEKISSILKKTIKGFDVKETQKILDFLTLKSEEILQITGDKNLAKDLPIWEYQKRPCRYTIKSLIVLDKKYYWGPHSVEKCAHVWTNISTNGTLPADFNTPNVDKILNINQKSIEESLEEKTKEIMKRFTPYVERVNFSRGTHPQEIGEFDALVYLEDKNIILNIECKDILGAYCLKDAKRVREKIFRPEFESAKKGNKRKVRHPGNLIIVEKRAAYLNSNIDKFKTILDWPIKKDPNILSIYITRTDYWWTEFPPRDTEVKFMRIDFLEKYIQDLLKGAK